MNYELSTTLEGLPLIIVNENIYFAYDPNDLDTYGVFMDRLNTKGMALFAQLLANDPSTAFTLFCE